MSEPKPRVFEDLDEAMGELLHLFSIAARLERIGRFGERVGPMPHELDGELFHACWRVLNQQRFPTAQACVDILFEVYLPEGNKQLRRYRDKDTNADKPTAKRRRRK